MIRTKQKAPVKRRGATALQQASERLSSAMEDVTGMPFNPVPAKRGRPPSGKIMVTLRLDPDVVAKFKADGPGWQARMNDALRKA